MNKYIFTYDIEEDRIRNKVSSLLEGYADRVQYSVFEGDMPEKVKKRLERDILGLLNLDTDRFFIYKICEKCLDKSAKYGYFIDDGPEDDEPFVII